MRIGDRIYVKGVSQSILTVVKHNLADCKYGLKSDSGAYYSVQSNYLYNNASYPKKTRETLEKTIQSKRKFKVGDQVILKDDGNLPLKYDGTDAKIIEIGDDGRSCPYLIETYDGRNAYCESNIMVFPEDYYVEQIEVDDDNTSREDLIQEEFEKLRGISTDQCYMPDECNHSNKYINSAGGKDFWFCKICRKDLGDA